MFSSEWCLLLALGISASGVEIVRHDDADVICSEGLSECIVKDWFFLEAENLMKIQSVKPHVKLCCSDQICQLCLSIDTEFHIPPDGDWKVEGDSTTDHKYVSKEIMKPKASVTVCYRTAVKMETCKMVEFTVDHEAFSHQSNATISLVITQPNGFHFNNQVFVFLPKQTPGNHLSKEIITPSLNEVCSQDLQKFVPQCPVPMVHLVPKQEMIYVELQIEGRDDDLPSICVQYEKNGRCQRWNRTFIPRYSLTPCMCLQVWKEDNYDRRLLLCPFDKTDFLNISQKNMWDNVSVSVCLREMTDFRKELLWNVSAPCRLEGEVRLCHSESSCTRSNVPRQQLVNDAWRQDPKGFWVSEGVFENSDKDLQLSLCVMIKVKGAEHDFGPFCMDKPHRGHWVLLVVGGLLIIGVITILFYCFHDFVKTYGKGHVVLLSPPDLDDGVSESICQLGSDLVSQGFSVSVDQWSRKEQCIMGPLPWLHAQLLKVGSMGGRVVLILNHNAWERTEEWTALSTHFELKEEEEEEPPLMWSPYADTFTASLFLIQAEKQLGGGRARGRFVLLKFGFHQKPADSIDMGLPDLLQGLPLFHLPSQTGSFLNELTAAKPRTGSRKQLRRKRKTYFTSKAKKIRKLSVSPNF